MPIELRWFVENQVIHATFSGTILFDEMKIMVKQSEAMLDSAPDEVALVHYLYDIGSLTHLPLKLKPLSEIGHNAFKHPKRGWTLVYGLNNQMFHYLVSMLGQLFKVRYRFFDTQAEALAFLQEIDASLPPLSIVQE